MLILSKGPSIGGENLPLARFASANLKEDEDFDDEIDFAEEIASRRVLFRLVLFFNKFCFYYLKWNLCNFKIS